MSKRYNLHRSSLSKDDECIVNNLLGALRPPSTPEEDAERTVRDILEESSKSRTYANRKDTRR
jgi:hypothetical protein